MSRLFLLFSAVFIAFALADKYEWHSIKGIFLVDSVEETIVNTFLDTLTQAVEIKKKSALEEIISESFMFTICPSRSTKTKKQMINNLLSRSPGFRPTFLSATTTVDMTTIYFVADMPGFSLAKKAEFTLKRGIYQQWMLMDGKDTICN